MKEWFGNLSKLRTLWTRLACVGVVGCAACYVQAATITIGVSPSPVSLPLYVAEKQGYFRAEGLDIALLECPTGSACLKQLLESRVQLATTSDLPIMFRSFEAVPFKVLATFATSQDVKFIARVGSGIKTSKDLKGRNVAVVSGAAGQYVLDLALLAAGVDPKAVSIVDLDVRRLDLAAANPKIDVFVLFQPGAYQLRKLLGTGSVELTVPRLYTLTFNLVAPSGPSAAPAENHTRILRALARAVDFIAADPTTAKGIARQRLNLEAADIAVMWPDYRFGLSLNQSLIATLESTAQWALQGQLIKGTAMPNYLDFIDVEPLKQLRPAAVTVIK